LLYEVPTEEDAFQGLNEHKGFWFSKSMAPQIAIPLLYEVPTEEDAFQGLNEHKGFWFSKSMAPQIANLGLSLLWYVMVFLSVYTQMLE
jgi:hypothetical protein